MKRLTFIAMAVATLSTLLIPVSSQAQEQYPNKTIRFVVHNAGKVAHELVLGSDEDIRAHAEDMKKGTDHSHSHAGAAAISVAPGQTGELVVTFSKTGTLQMACLIPGHYEAGMKGQLSVTSEGALPSPAKSKNSAHDHSTHKH